MRDGKREEGEREGREKDLYHHYVLVQTHELNDHLTLLNRIQPEKNYSGELSLSPKVK